MSAMGGDAGGSASIHEPVGAPDESSDAGGGGDDGLGSLDGAGGDAGGGEPAWKPPTRDEYEAMRGHAEIGQRYAPFREQIDKALAAGLSPQQAQQAASQARAEGKPVEKKIAEWRRDRDKYVAQSQSPDGFEQMFDELHNERAGPMNQKQEALEKTLQELQGRFETLYNHAVYSQEAFAKDPKWESVQKEALELVRSRQIPNVKLAREFVEMKRKVSELQRAAAGGAAAGARPAAPAQVGGKRAPAPPPRPRNDPALRPSTAPRGAGVTSAGASKGGTQRKGEGAFEYARRAALAEVRGA